VWEKDVPVPQWEYIFESIPQLQRDVHKLQKLWQIQSSVGMTSLLSLSQELWHTSDATEAKRVHRSHGGVKIKPKEVSEGTSEGRAGQDRAGEWERYLREVRAEMDPGVRIVSTLARESFGVEDRFEAKSCRKGNAHCFQDFGNHDSVEFNEGTALHSAGTVRRGSGEREAHEGGEGRGKGQD
jgi:hypothetical protein